MKKLVFAILILCPAVCALADTPPTWDEFDVASPNKAFIAKVTVKDKNGKKERYEWSFSLAVYKADAPATPLWSLIYPYLGDPGGFLSDDGKFFADIEFWYHDEPDIIRIYREGKRVAEFTGKELALDKTKLKKTASHLLWWNEQARPKFEGGKELVIPTIDDQVFRIDLTTLKLKAERAK